ncbi:hypothetical protein [uncultured Sphingomonas sp.]|uniref:hypothetical protein n=1 Tax=uncultured Sphingomonas sp. TaxID=158754 RepID=UPI0035CC0D39
MADDTPDAPAAETAPAPAPTRRRVGRPAAVKPEGAAPKPARKPRAVKSTIAKAEEAVVDAASKPAAAVAGAARSAAKAVKPRAAKRATPPTGGKGRGKKTPAKSGRSWGSVAIAGGLAAAGAAATAAVFALRGSTPKPKEPPVAPDVKAHQPDGTDSTKSFGAGIADESTIPEEA